MFSFFKKLFGGKTPDTSAAQAPYKLEVAVDNTQITDSVTVAETKSEIKPQRTKDSKGKFLADDPRTEHNEAWVGGKSPAKKPRRPRNRKPAIAEGSVRINVKQPNPSAKKPKAPPAPKPKK